jgi:hypothetical protein
MKKSIVTAAILAATIGAAQAADIGTPPAPPAPPPAAPAFSWDGPYIGAFVGGYPTSPAGEAGATLGVNFQTRSALLFGVEAQAGLVVAPANPLVFEAIWNGRLGVVVGPNDGVLLFGEGGVAFNTGGGFGWDAGGGVEFAAGDSAASINVKAGVVAPFGGPPTVHFQVGLNWHFGN